MIRGASLAALIVLASAGCGGPNLDVEPWCQLGTGEVEWVPMFDGDEAWVVRGIQGGDHIWGSARVTGLDWTEITLIFEILDEEGFPVTDSSRLTTSLTQCPRSMEGCDPGMGETVGFPILVENPSEIVGDDIILRLTAADGSGRSTATDEYAVKARRATSE